MKLGVNIDHVATVRQARRDKIPNLLQAAIAAQRGGADNITIHLREDRRHIQDADVKILRRKMRLPINLEMAATSEITAIAIRERVQKVCLVPEKRRELTTEGGLNIAAQKTRLKKIIPQLKKARISVSLFVDPDFAMLRLAQQLNADAVELHTGRYANAATLSSKKHELQQLLHAANYAHELGLELHAGHGLDYDNVQAIARIPGMHTLNIGFAIVARALFVGMEKAVRTMRQKM